MGAAIVKLASNCALTMVKEAMGRVVGPSQFAVETKGGCALLQWALQLAMEVKPALAGASLDAINACGEIEREYIEAAIKANLYLHRLLPLYEIMYKKGEGCSGTTTRTATSSWEPRTKEKSGKALFWASSCLALPWR